VTGARADHHVAIRVSDIERAARFYCDALGGRLVARPIERSGPYIESVFGPGAHAKVCHVAFAANAVELWEFVAPRHPLPDSDQTALGIMHFAVTVDDVPAALARVEAAGGRARFPVKPVAGGGAASFVYCEDLDGNVFELLDVDHPETVRLVIESNPDAAP